MTMQHIEGKDGIRPFLTSDQRVGSYVALVGRVDHAFKRGDDGDADIDGDPVEEAPLLVNPIHQPSIPPTILFRLSKPY